MVLDSIGLHVCGFNSYLMENGLFGGACRLFFVQVSAFGKAWVQEIWKPTEVEPA